MARYLLLTGAGIFLLFGCAHGILALRDLWLPRTFTPTDDSVRHAMQDSRVAINPHTNVWDAWLGFNLSHALGLAMFGGSLVVIAWRYFRLFAESPWIQFAALLVAAAYFILSIRFWFRAPAVGSAVGFLCFLGAVILSAA